jgi:hypothetical protein
MLYMEIATWAPKHRDFLLKDSGPHFADYIKANGPLQLSVRNSGYKPGVQQLWWDITSNRSFCLWWEGPDANNPMALYKEYKPLLDIANFELFSVVEIVDLFEEAELPGWEKDPSAPASPKLQMEITTWPAENRAELIKRTAPFIKQFGSPPVTMKDSKYKPGILQLWWDMINNRSFCLLYDMPDYDKPQGMYAMYKLGLDIVDFELVPVMEIADVIEGAQL